MYICVYESVGLTKTSKPHNLSLTFKLVQELDNAMTEALIGKSLVTQRRDVVLGRHCESYLQFQFTNHSVVDVLGVVVLLYIIMMSQDAGAVCYGTDSSTPLLIPKSRCL